MPSGAGAKPPLRPPSAYSSLMVLRRASPGTSHHFSRTGKPIGGHGRRPAPAPVPRHDREMIDFRSATSICCSLLEHDDRTGAQMLSLCPESSMRVPCRPSSGICSLLHVDGARLIGNSMSGLEGQTREAFLSLTTSSCTRADSRAIRPVCDLASRWAGVCVSALFCTSALPRRTGHLGRIRPHRDGSGVAYKWTPGARLSLLRCEDRKVSSRLFPGSLHQPADTLAISD